MSNRPSQSRRPLGGPLEHWTLDIGYWTLKISFGLGLFGGRLRGDGRIGGGHLGGIDELAGVDEFLLVFLEKFGGGFRRGGSGIVLLDFLDGAVERLPFLEFGVAGESGGARAIRCRRRRIEDDEREIGEQGVVVVAEAEIESPGRRGAWRGFPRLLSGRGCREVFDGGRVLEAAAWGSDAGEDAGVGVAAAVPATRP